MGDKESKKITDENSSSDEDKENNARFPQRMKDYHQHFRDFAIDYKAATSAQRWHRYEDGKCRNQELNDAKSKKGHPEIKKSNVDGTSSSSHDKSDASFSPTDNVHAFEKGVAKFNHKKSEETSLNNFKAEELVQNLVLYNCESLNGKLKKHDKEIEIFLHEERLEQNIFKEPDESNLLHLSTSRQGDHASTSSPESQRKFRDTYEITTTSLSDTYAVPSTSACAAEENIELIDMFDDLNFENFDEKSSLEINISDFSDSESTRASKKTRYRKRKSLNKYRSPNYEHDIELKKRRVETPSRQPHVNPFHLPFRKHSSEDDVKIDAKRKLKKSASSKDVKPKASRKLKLSSSSEDLKIDAKQKLKLSSSSEDDKRHKGIKKRPISKEDRSSPETQDSSCNLKKIKTF